MTWCRRWGCRASRRAKSPNSATRSTSACSPSSSARSAASGRICGPTWWAAEIARMPSNPQETVETTPIAALKPYSGNACVHSKKQIRQIATSIERFGFTNPVLISDENEIIAGHGRVEAANLLGLNTVPTLRLSHLDAAQRRAYVLADNKLALNAGWDRETLAIELQALVDLKFEVRRRAYGHPARVGETVLAFATWSAPSRLRPGGAIASQVGTAAVILERFQRTLNRL